VDASAGSLIQQINLDGLSEFTRQNEQREMVLSKANNETVTSGGKSRDTKRFKSGIVSNQILIRTWFTLPTKRSLGDAENMT